MGVARLDLRLPRAARTAEVNHWFKARFGFGCAARAIRFALFNVRGFDDCVVRFGEVDDGLRQARFKQYLRIGSEWQTSALWPVQWRVGFHEPIFGAGLGCAEP